MFSFFILHFPLVLALISSKYLPLFFVLSLFLSSCSFSFFFSSHPILLPSLFPSLPSYYSSFFFSIPSTGYLLLDSSFLLPNHHSFLRILSIFLLTILPSYFLTELLLLRFFLPIFLVSISLPSSHPLFLCFILFHPTFFLLPVVGSSFLPIFLLSYLLFFSFFLVFITILFPFCL